MRARISYLILAVAFAAVLISSLPVQARFLQTDPTGYADDPDLYTYVQNNPTNEADPLGLYGQACSTPDGSCGSGFDDAQGGAAGALRGASNALTNALNDMHTVASRNASGDASAHISAGTESTIAAFNHAFGSGSDVDSRMATVLSAVNASLSAVEDASGSEGHMAVSPNTLSTTYGSHAYQMSTHSAPIATSRLGDHQIMVDVSQWNGINSEQRRWAIIHDSFHAESGWHDWKDSGGQKYMHFGPNGMGIQSPLHVPPGAATTNPENATCFVMGGC